MKNISNVSCALRFVADGERRFGHGALRQRTKEEDRIKKIGFANAIRASDATHASISLVPDAQNALVKTYQTADGGRTWFSAPSNQ